MILTMSSRYWSLPPIGTSILQFHRRPAKDCSRPGRHALVS